MQTEPTSEGAPVFNRGLLPAYAAYLLGEKLHEFSTGILTVSRELQMPLLRYFEAMPEDELIALGMDSNQKLLSALANNGTDAYLAEVLRSWTDNQLPLVQDGDIVIEDISKGNFARRKVFRDMLPGYCTDTATYIGVMEEVDRFTLTHEEVFYKTLFEIKERKIREHHHFIDKINNASPGIIYVYDLHTQRRLYANHKRETLLGYTDADMAAMEDSGPAAIVHPDDLPGLMQHRKYLMTAGTDTEPRTIEFRVRSKGGVYLWQRAYETVFRRSADGGPLEIIGIAIDISAEKEATLALAQREQQLREAQEIAGMGSFEWDLQGDESQLSPNLLHILALEKGRSLLDFLAYVHPADRDGVKRAIAHAIGGAGAYEAEYRYKKDGPEKVLWSRGKVVFEGGRAIRIKGTVMDVTQRHDMLKRLARSEGLHKQAQALTRLGNWTWSLSDDAVEWSDEMYRIFGLEPQCEAMTLGRILPLLHPDDREARREGLHSARATGIGEDYTMRVLQPDGAVKWVAGKSEVLRDDEGKQYKIAGTCQDITEQHGIAERLREEEEASRSLINNAPEAIVVIDSSSRIRLWNPQAATIFGWTAEEISGKTLMETIIPHAFRGAHSAGIVRLQATGEARLLNRTIEVEALKRSGEAFYISLTISQSLRGGEVVYIAFVRDISEERANALKLQEQQAQLAQKALALERSNGELTSFNYIASHDLKEPVRKIKMFSNIIAINTATPLPPSLRAPMERITAAADHMERLIEALIVFSRTNASERKVESVDLSQIVAEVMSQLSDRIEATCAVVTVGALPRLPAIPFQMAQLFDNLIGNALKYCAPGVPPRVSITANEVGGDAIGDDCADAAARYYCISVADNGIGFEQQYAAKVFEVFQRLHNRDAYAGTGIGLAVCKKIVQQHDGFITAHSAPGEGARFDVFLPV